MKYLTKFTTAADYAQAKDDLYAPNVSLLNDSKSINYKSIDLPIITVVFDITDISEETYILWSSEPEEVVAGIEIDGIKLQTLVKTYQFSTTGEHIVKYTLKDRKKIEDYMLYNCADIKSIIIPNCVKEIGEGSFRGCNKATSVTIPNGVEIIGYRAFRFWQALTSIKLPNSVTTLKGETFYDCPQLTTVKLSKNLINCSNYEFYKCNNLSDIENNIVYADCFAVKVTNKTLSSYTLKEGTKFLEADCFNECTNITSIGPKGSNASLELPNNIKHIGYNCFKNCTGLTSVKLPDDAILRSYCFSGCTGLTSIGPKGSNASLELPNNLTVIEGNCFDGCTNITDVVLPNSITNVSFYVFNKCANLVSVTLPESVEAISFYIFSGCTKLKTIIVKSVNPPKLSGDLFGSTVVEGRKIYVPAESVDAYKTANYWSSYAADIEAIQ